jgi:hypothetical protein
MIVLQRCHTSWRRAHRHEKQNNGKMRSFSATQRPNDFDKFYPGQATNCR